MFRYYHFFVSVGLFLTLAGGQDSFAFPDRFDSILGASSNCGLDEFRCDNGQCISSELLCDGKIECRDGSDETRIQCLQFSCPVFSFKCDYGACVDGDAKCNGVDDCADKSDERLAECRKRRPTTGRPSSCSSDQFQCGNGECIDFTRACDGSPDCIDRSDETSTNCASNRCSPFSFKCSYGACIDGDKKCDGVRNCADGSDEDHKVCSGSSVATPLPPTPTSYPNQRPTPRPTQRPVTQSIWTQRPQSTCPPPPEIANGFWRLHSSQCQYGDNCEPRQGMTMVPGTQLVYSCLHSFHLSGSGDVFCRSGGSWSHVPTCEETRCPTLSSASTKADCTLNNQWASCETPAQPGTQAVVSCRTSYRPQEGLLRRDRVTCNSRGQWEPEPIKCTPVCGTKPLKNIKPLIVGGSLPNITDFPWHATVYTIDPNTNEKVFTCGATIITDRLLITAAHCVFDEVTKRVENPRKYVIATGNFFRDYNFEYPPPMVVQKARVKNIYISCDYRGLDGNYDRDIAILHIDTPLVFTSYRVPICLDITTGRRAIEFGTEGVVAGFGKTAEGSFSSILQSLSVPVVPNNLCAKNSPTIDAQRFITLDKFCAGYTNGSSVCDGDSGGGLAFETNNLWYLRGIVSVGLGVSTVNGRSCDAHRYALYTEVLSHISWIQDVILKVERRERIRDCSKSR